LFDKNLLLFVGSIGNTVLCVKKILTTKCRVWTQWPVLGCVDGCKPSGRCCCLWRSFFPEIQAGLTVTSCFQMRHGVM